MCQICELERGKKELLMCHDMVVAINNRKIDDGELDISIGRNDDGNYSLFFDYCIDRGILTASLDMPIKFCPFCGKALQHEAAIEYPWNQEKRG